MFMSCSLFLTLPLCQFTLLAIPNFLAWLRHCTVACLVCKFRSEKGENLKMMKKNKKVQWFWTWVIGSIILRLILVYFPKNLNLSSRPEASTPLTSIRRRKLPFLTNSSSTTRSFLHFNSILLLFAVAEGYWLKQSSMSPYAGFSFLYSSN
jgi:hypothetical protein